MSFELIVVLLGAGVMAFIAVGVYRRIALSRRWFDLPNERSSHTQPTPGGGGIALAMLLLFFLVAACISGQLASPETGDVSAVWIASMAIVLSLLGWCDDRYGLSRLLRGGAFIGCAATLVIVLMPSGWLVSALWLLFLFVFVNVFNFMDGTDGLAASESVFFFLAMAFFTVQVRENYALLMPMWLLAGLGIGFLFWNWAPARVFLGDSGSLCLGLLMAGLAMVAHRDEVVHISVSLILLAVFLTESLTIIVLRALNRERITEAHRSHVYQLLAVRWQSHGRVALVYLSINILFVFPAACLAHQNPAQRTIILISCYAILSAAIVWFRTTLLKSTVITDRATTGDASCKKE